MPEEAHDRGWQEQVSLPRTLKQITRRAPRRTLQPHITADALCRVQTQTFDGLLFFFIRRSQLCLSEIGLAMNVNHECISYLIQIWSRH